MSFELSVRFSLTQDSQLGTGTRDGKGIASPCVVDQLMGINFDVNIQKITTPLVAGSRNTLAVDAEGGVSGVLAWAPTILTN